MSRVLQLKLFVATAVLVTGASVGVLVGMLVVRGSPSLQPVVSSASDLAQDTSVGIPVPGPKSIQELVNRAEAIVVGTIGPVRRTEMVGPNDDLSKYPADKPLPLLPFTDYQINIEEVVLDDGFIRAEPTMSLGGSPGGRHGYLFPMRLSSSDRYLFALTRNPYRINVHGLMTEQGLVNLSGATVALTDPDRSAPAYAEEMPPSDFLEAVKAALPTRKHSPPSEWRDNVVFVTSDQVKPQP